MSDLLAPLLLGLAFLCGCLYAAALDCKSWTLALLSVVAYGLLVLAVVFA